MIDFANIKHQPKIIKIGNNLDYLKLYYLLRARHATTYLFESLVLPEQQDRYFTFGFDPKYTLSAKQDKLIVKNKGVVNDYQVDNPYEELKKFIPDIPQANPYQGGLIGYFSYESFNYFENSLKLKPHPEFPLFELGLYLDGLVYDNKTDELIYYTYDQDRSSQILELVGDIDKTSLPDKLKSADSTGFNIKKEDYTRAVRNTLEEIRSGNSFQVEVGLKKKYKIQGDKFSIYNQLRSTNPSPYMYFLDFEERELFGASPELVVSLKSGQILTTPAAGTIERGETEEDDKQKAQNLRKDPKEVAEHAMLVDMHRNDISKVAEYGSVRVDKLMHIMKFNYVQHLVSDITGELQSNKDCFDLLSSIMPCGVLTGAPKIETMKIIQKNEAEPRGPYGGAVGRFSFNGDCVFAMPIRSLFFNGDEGFNQACAGIVFDSQPEKEYAEVVAKLKGMEKSIKQVSL